MQISYFLLIAALCALAAYGLWIRTRPRIDATDEVPSYKVRQPLLTEQERAYYKILRRTIGDRFVIFPKVRLADMLEHPGTNPKFRLHWLRAQRLSVDLLVVDLCWRPVLVVKFGPSPRRNRVRQDVLEEALEAADLPLLRVKLLDSYNVDEVTYKVRFAMARHIPESSGPDGRSKMGDDGPYIEPGFVDSGLHMIKRWTSDLWIAARRTH